MGLNPDFDLIVHANSFYGISAALGALAAGAQVAVCDHPYGDMALCSGVLDLGFSKQVVEKRGIKTTLYEHIEEIIAYEKNHPYARLGFQKTSEILEKSLQLLNAAVQHLNILTDLNFGISPLGQLIPGWVFLKTQNDASFFAGEQTWAFVEIKEDQHCMADHVKKGIEHDAKMYNLDLPSIEILPISFKPSLHKNAVQLAKVFDDDAHELLNLIGQKAADCSGLILPPVMGIKNFLSIHQLLQNHLELKTFELLGHIPSVPGLRLQQACEKISGFTKLPAPHVVTEKSVVLSTGETFTAHRVLKEPAEKFSTARHGAALVLGYLEARA